MSGLFVALALLSQQPPVQPPVREETPFSTAPTPGQAMFDAEQHASTAESRLAMHRFGQCVADRNPELVASTLARDFRTPAYRTGLRTLADRYRDCMTERGRMRSASLLFAASMAERLVERDPTRVNVRLARAAAMPAPAAFAPSDAIAICVVRSAPDQVARLFASDPASAEEAAAAAELRPVADLCAGTRARVQGSDGALRAILATAAFRTLRAANPANVAEH